MDNHLIQPEWSHFQNEQIAQKITQEHGSEDDLQEAVEQSLQNRFAPELLNRIDEKIVFTPLQQKEIRSIVDLQIAQLARRVMSQGLNLIVTDMAKDEISKVGFDPVYGARPLKRVIQQKIENPLATELLKGNFSEQAGVLVDFKSNEFTFEATDTGTCAETVTANNSSHPQ